MQPLFVQVSATLYLEFYLIPAQEKELVTLHNRIQQKYKDFETLNKTYIGKNREAKNVYHISS